MAKRKPKYDYLQITYYTKDEGDEEGSAIGGDYSWIELRDKQGELVVWYGDYYHDKGEEKMSGFIDAIKCFNAPYSIKIEYEEKETLEYSPEGKEYE